MDCSKSAPSAQGQSQGSDELDQVTLQAELLKSQTSSANLLIEFGDLPKSPFSLDAYVLYSQTFLEESGVRSDPLERILVEQAMMTHHKIGRLNRLAGTAASTEEARALDSVAVLFVGELRRLVLAIQSYRAGRSPSPAPQVRENPVDNKQREAASSPMARIDEVDASCKQDDVVGGNRRKSSQASTVPTAPDRTQLDGSSGRDALPPKAPSSPPVTGGMNRPSRANQELPPNAHPTVALSPTSQNLDKAECHPPGSVGLQSAGVGGITQRSSRENTPVNTKLTSNGTLGNVPGDTVRAQTSRCSGQESRSAEVLESQPRTATANRVSRPPRTLATEAPHGVTQGISKPPNGTRADQAERVLVKLESP